MNVNFTLRAFSLIIAYVLCTAKLYAGEAIAGLPIPDDTTIINTTEKSETEIYSKENAACCPNSEQIISTNCKLGNTVYDSITAEEVPQVFGKTINNTSYTFSAAKKAELSEYSANESIVHIANDDFADIDSSIYIPLSEYTIAGTRRYTIDNSHPKRINKIKPWAAVAVGASYFGILAGLHIYQMNTLWNDKMEFRFFEDINQDYFADKFGHFFGSYFAGYGSTEVLIGAGFSYNTAYILGGTMGLLYQTYVEIMDGFGKNWGFSPSDFYADAAGFVYYLAQHYIPFLQNFTPKSTYFPARWYDEKPRKEAMMFIDDYSSWTMWLSANMHNLMPKSWKWPRWLNIAAGYAVRDLRYDEITGEFKGDPRFSIALDYNLVELLPDSYNFLNWLKQSLNYFKFPAPAIEFGNVTKFRLLYPFVISFGAGFKF